MTKLSSLILSAVLIALPVSSMAAYEGGDVKDGGTISGTVKFKGTAPAPKKLDVGKDKEVCAKSPKLDPSLIVNNGNLANAVVTITDDGVGGANTKSGSGLRGLADRVEAVGGKLRIWSPPGRGTRIEAEIPCV